VVSARASPRVGTARRLQACGPRRRRSPPTLDGCPLSEARDEGAYHGHIYTCTTQEGALSAEQRAVIATAITRIHSAHTGEPAKLIWVIFETVSPDGIYAAGKPTVNALIVGLFRERGTQVKARVLNDLWSMYKNVTGLSDDQLWVSLTAISLSDAMMFGAILPEPGHEAEWLASLGRTKEYA
jgi:phenylpyruvate tautomerase PptA (4-oxalocrotonate tautomerase family)